MERGGVSGYALLGSAEPSRDADIKKSGF